MTGANILGQKISDRDRFFAGKEARMRIHVNSDGRFQIPLPKFAVPVLGYERVGGSTKDEVESAWLRAERQYTERMKEKQKVIVYKIKVNAFIMNAEGTKRVFRADEITFAEGSGLVMAWSILYRHTRSDINEITYHDEDGDFIMSDDSERDGVTWIPWSQAAEDFFRSCEDRLKTLGMNLWNFLHQEPTQVEARIMDASALLDYKPTKKQGV